jgi:hypothetical protein
MGQTVEANGRSILHKGHGMTHASAVPDVCKTPTPGGPVPIPYPNFAMDSNLVSGASSVKIEGNPVATVKSKIGTSTGDEPGSVGGIMSGVFKGTCTWKMGSLNVKAEGNSVVRFLDPTFHNGNSFNSTWIDNGGPALGYADDFDGPCPICGQGPREHGIPSRPSSAAVCAELMTRLMQRADAFNRAGPQSGLLSVGRNYMVGVMVCKCALTGATPNTFATMSGDTNAGFTEVAGGTPGVHQVLGGGPATPANFATANTSQLATLEHKWLAVAAAVQEVEANRAARRGGYNNVGQCAGAKLLARSGHAPIAMTEMYFQPAHRLPPQGRDALWTATYEWRVEGIRVDDEDFNAQDAPVGSCNTCQRTLYLTMCPNRVCGGGGSAGGTN